MADDLDPKDQGKTGDPGTQGGSSDTDYEAKYIGLNKAHSKVLNRLNDMQKKFDDLQEQYETLQSESKSAAKPLQDQIRDLQAKMTAAEADANKWKGDFEALQGKQTLGGKLKEAWKSAPGLFEMWEAGDVTLKDRSTFEDDAKYDEYLARMAAKVGPASSEPPPPPPPDPNLEEQRRRFGLGATPPTPGAERGSKGVKRTLNEIQNEMWNLDTSTTDGKRKYDDLTRELDQVLG